jgi:predicted enzyme related to lactoylglutathione lyase
MNGVVHFEVPTDNLLRARRFYAEVFGWKATDIPELGTVMLETTDSDYGRPKQPGAINGSMTARGELGKQPVIVIAVQSIDATIALVEQSGGCVVQPKVPVGEAAHYARIIDSEGNVIGLWE